MTNKEYKEMLKHKTKLHNEQLTSMQRKNISIRRFKKLHSRGENDLKKIARTEANGVYTFASASHEFAKIIRNKMRTYGRNGGKGKKK